MRSTDPKFAVLRSLLLFDGISRRRLRSLLQRVDEVEVDRGTVLIEQHQLNHHAYVLVSGSVSVHVDGTRVATVGAGQIVGERAALTHEPANATVVVEDPAVVLALDHRALLGLTAEVPAVRERLHTLVDHRDAAIAA